MTRTSQSHRRRQPGTARYALVVDRQIKRDFEEKDIAEQEAQRLRGRFPHLQVTVEDLGPDAKSA